MAETRYVSRQEAATTAKANLAIPYKKATGAGGTRTPTSGKAGQTTEARARNSAGQGAQPNATARGAGQPTEQQSARNTQSARQVLQGSGGKVDDRG